MERLRELDTHDGAERIVGCQEECATQPGPQITERETLVRDGKAPHAVAKDAGGGRLIVDAVLDVLARDIQAREGDHEAGRGTVLPIEAAIEVPASLVEDILPDQAQSRPRTVRAKGGDDLSQILLDRYGSPS